MGQGEEDVSVHLVGENGMSMSGLTMESQLKGRVSNFGSIK